MLASIRMGIHAGFGGLSSPRFELSPQPLEPMLRNTRVIGRALGITVAELVR